MFSFLFAKKYKVIPVYGFEECGYIIPIEYDITENAFNYNVVVMKYNHPKFEGVAILDFPKFDDELDRMERGESGIYSC